MVSREPFPACAGLNRSERLTGQYPRPVPCVCGAEPVTWSLERAKAARSLRVRG